MRYICTKGFKVNVFDGNGKQTNEFKEIKKGEVFDVRKGSSRKLLGLKVIIIENEKCWVEIAFERLSTNFRRITNVVPVRDPVTVGDRVRMLRQKRGLTQAKMAEKIGFSRRVIENVELNKYDPSFITLVSLADFFDVSMDYLAGRDKKYYGGEK